MTEWNYENLSKIPESRVSKICIVTESESSVTGRDWENLFTK
ncbi:MAG: hypothetical protein RL728_941 [Bacteroidota bacterium]|jgi:hypothetical protein